MKARITVTVDEETLRAAEREVANGRARSLSAFVAEAIESQVKRESLKDVMADIRAEIGPPTEEETSWAREVLGL